MQPVLSFQQPTRFSRNRFSQVKFVYFIGPTCVGKGYLMTILLRSLGILMRRRMINLGTVSFGDIVKSLLESNSAFAAAYTDTIKKGNLVPDSEVIPLFQNEVEKMICSGMPNIILVDGFCRSPAQIAFAAEHGYLAKGDRVFMIEADESTCLARFMHRCEKRPDGRTRIDAELPTFHHRYRAHQHVGPQLRALFLETDCVLTEVNGNDDIAHQIAPGVQNTLEESFMEAIDSMRYPPVDRVTA